MGTHTHTHPSQYSALTYTFGFITQPVFYLFPKSRCIASTSSRKTTICMGRTRRGHCISSTSSFYLRMQPTCGVIVVRGAVLGRGSFPSRRARSRRLGRGARRPRLVRLRRARLRRRRVPRHRGAAHDRRRRRSSPGPAGAPAYGTAYETRVGQRRGVLRSSSRWSTS